MDTPAVRDKTFVYLDPPYYRKGQKLYLNFYQHADHDALAKFMQGRARFRWVLTYDDAAPIRALYSKSRQKTLSIGYSARSVRKGRELLIASEGLHVPKEWGKSVPKAWVSSTAAS